jgi:60 kDa SS-A/Ro ribonucleoprotein
MDYTFTNQRGKNKHVSEDQPIPGRESEMKKNLAGGYSFKANDWQALRRWLLTGSMSGSFYQGKEEMTDSNIELLKKCMADDPVKVGEEIIEASKMGVSVHTPIFATVAMSLGDKRAKDVFKDIFPSVVRTASHLYEAFNYIRGMRGFGSVIHKAGLKWLNNKDPKELEYQFLKYQKRYDWAGRDILRVLKPKTQDELRKAVYNWVVGGTDKNPLMKVFPEELERINVYEALKSGKMSEEDVVQAINNFRLTHEMIPGNVTRTKKIWEALFHNMPVGASVRNLGNLTEKGIFDDVENIDILENKLSESNLKKAYMHPVNLANAQMIYLDGGNTGKSKLEWDPVPRVNDILEDAIETSFDVLEPTGNHFFHALDVSGSMSGPLPMSKNSNNWLKPYQIAGIMALASVKAEKNYYVGGFDTEFKQLANLNKKTSYSEVTNFQSRVWPHNFGGTDASSAYRHAIDKNIKTDVFVFWTDSESWAGGSYIFDTRSRTVTGHPSELLKQYRKKVNKDAKAVYVTLIPYSDQITLVDPKDKKSYDIAGFTSQTPKLIQMIANQKL